MNQEMNQDLRSHNFDCKENLTISTLRPNIIGETTTDASEKINYTYTPTWVEYPSTEIQQLSKRMDEIENRLQRLEELFKSIKIILDIKREL